MQKNTSDLIVQVASGVSNLWKNYKRSAMHRTSTPMQSFWNDMLGLEMNDIDALKMLAEDVEKLRCKRQVMKTEKAFKKIVDNQLK